MRGASGAEWVVQTTCRDPDAALRVWNRREEGEEAVAAWWPTRREVVEIAAFWDGAFDYRNDDTLEDEDDSSS